MTPFWTRALVSGKCGAALPPENSRLLPSQSRNDERGQGRPTASLGPANDVARGVLCPPSPLPPAPTTACPKVRGSRVTA